MKMLQRNQNIRKLYAN